MTPRLVRRRYSKGRARFVVPSRGYRYSGMCAAAQTVAMGGGRAPRTSKRIEPSAPTSACQSKKKKKKRGDGRRRIKGTKDKKKKKKDFKGIAGGGQKEGIVNALVAGQTIEEQVACVGA